jgi:hypothetical protein
MLIRILIRIRLLGMRVEVEMGRRLRLIGIRMRRLDREDCVDLCGEPFYLEEGDVLG